MFPAPGTAAAQVLLVTPDHDFGSTASEQLPAGAEIEVTVAETVTEAVAVLGGEGGFDCIVSDHDLPDFDGIALLEVVRAQAPSLPFVLFTSEGNEAVASRAITAGVTEYLIKERHRDQWDKLATLVTDAVDYYRKHGEFVKGEERAQTLLDNSYDGIFVIRNGQCEYVNRTGLDLLGLEERAAIDGESIGAWIDTAAEESIETILEAVGEDREQLDRQEGRLHRRGGSTVPVLLAATGVSWGGGPAEILVARDIRERKELEHDLQVKERAIDAVPIGVAIAEGGGEAPITAANERQTDLTDEQMSELLGRSLWDHLVETGAGDAVESLRSAIEAGESATVEVDVERADGEPTWNRVSVAPITDESGSVTDVVAFQTDVTAERERDQELRRLERAVEAAGHAIYMTDPTGEIFYANSAFERITGYSEAEIIGRNPRILNSGEMPAGYYENLWATVTAGDIFVEEITNRRKSGDLYHAEQTIAPVVGSDDEIEAYVAIQTDITDRKWTERALRQYKQAVESSKDLLAAIDEDSKYLFTNETYREYHDIDEVDVSDRPLKKVLGPESFEEIRPSIAAAFDGDVVQTEVTRPHPDLGDRILDVRLFPLRDDEGAVKGVGASMRDITEDREHEAAVERESEFRRLMSEVNHELVRGDDIETVVSTVTEIVGASRVFGCTFSYLLENTRTSVVCEHGSELDDGEVDAIHDREYLDRVFEADILEIEDVTEPPFEQHSESGPSHSGLAIAISHDGERYGVLTVHFQPDVEISAHARAVLETIGGDLGFFIANRLLRAEYKTFTDIIERIDDPVMLQNRDGTFRIVNEAVSKLAGMPKSDLIGRDEALFMDEAAARKVTEMKSRVLETESPVSYKVSPTLLGGGNRTFSTVRYPAYNDAGRLEGTIAICRDITDLEEHQRQYRVLDRVLRHNVNNNMNVVQGYAEMIEARAGEELSRYAEKIAENGEQLLAIARKQRKITDFLADPDPIERIDIASIVDSLATRLRSEFPAAEISVSSPVAVEARARKAIEEAVEELVVNSIVHSTHGTPSVSIRVEERPDTVRIRVVDENRPIDEMDREVLTGSPELDALEHGSGLGLWLVKLIVEHSGGSVEYEEPPAGGNVVKIELPRT
ncbi:MAG: PAS domain S-box protein [Halodesulfurarchaeum sp.]